MLDLRIGARAALALAAASGPATARELVTESPEKSETSGSPASSARPTTAAGWLVLAVATAGGAGYGPYAPSTFGSAAGVILFLPLAGLGFPLFVLTTAALTALGVWAADEAERLFEKKDDGRIVIDEVAGQLVTLSPLLLLAPEKSFSPFWLVTGFVVFRVFDIWKPGPARWAERNLRGGMGVVMDDVIAGFFGALVMAAAIAVGLVLGGAA